jgi:hypothetical protein
MMELTRRSILTGITRTRDLPVTEEQLQDWLDGQLIQDAMPYLSPGQREWIISGIEENEWDEHFSEDE